jgi:hypothetical protein
MLYLTRRRVPSRPATAVVAGLALCGLALLAPKPVHATAGSAASSASQSVGFSIGSVSGSLKNASGSSSKAAEVAEADYEVVEVAAVADDADLLRLRLRLSAPAPGPATAALPEIELELPRRAVEQGQLAPGRSVSARHRVYGIEFASGEPREAFFLVLDDDWYRELRIQAVDS